MKSPTSSIHGFESQAKDYARPELSVTDLLIDNINSSSMFMMSEDFEPANLYRGDLIVIDADLKIRNGDFVVCLENGELKCKIFHFSSAETLNDDGHIVGVVTRSVRCIKPILVD